jgi:7-alpha-hydroxysteroid dehydrogenase
VILDLFRLDGKVAVISAGGRGIGARIATAFAEVGADVAIGARSADQLDDVKAQVEALGRRAVVVPGDLSTREGMAQLVDAAVRDLGRIDIVVNNAGGSMPQAFMDTSERAFAEALHWNVTTAFNLTQLAVPHLVAAGGGSVINITSVAGSFASRGFAAYGTAKGALIKLTRHLANDLSPKIRVNSISPGSIATSALDMVLKMPELEQAMIDATPLARLGTVDDIAAAAVYLASDAGSYVTGRDIRVDGGIEASNLEMPIPDL